MFRRGEYEIRFAATDQDAERIHQLNYRTFVQEIPQHRDTGTGVLVDKFHAKNKYLLCLRRDELVGMLSFHDQPPFSVSDRLPDPDVLTAPGLKLIEIRLLAVVPEERGSQVLAALVWQLYQHARANGYTHFVISGVENQQDLYRHLGFEALGPAVGTGTACFVPMWLPLGTMETKMGRHIALWERRLTRDERSAPMERAQVRGDSSVGH
ncbi:hypothetical protein BH11PLA2_BH11PLA2_09200 [soil metagenome]